MSLRVSDLSFSYGAKPALAAVSFALEPGRFAALLGPNGAGKSTLFALLTRLFVAPHGRIEIAGNDLARAPYAALARIGVVFQQPTLDLDLSVVQNLRYFAALHGLGGRGAMRRIDAALERMEMRERAGERVRVLNGGHRRRVEIARALLHDPAVLLLDEPSVGLDPGTRAALVDHVHALAALDGLTVLWATHLTDEVRPDDRLLLLHRGRLQADGTAHALQGDATLEAWFLARTRETA
ncbi:ATP-binding cassette domain-containing protein [Thalassococcus sp. CAU 1522]|uniref:ATP-binding cassette domain-containing protein n=1 Tax=Thalassococcus arenae TaxID=2851652 RepID=A0ABS6NA24_9RHOB|nr:ABC transporter ATP-binding protein [Thalassococcus arenae]MBV2360869.1 ATP-binding cassette domain-containing protein [Thalassococcus arenae]